MSVNKLIDFSCITSEKVLYNKTKQYNALQNLSESAWKAYTAAMHKNKVSVKYDAQMDAYIARPLKTTNESTMPNNAPVSGPGTKKMLYDDNLDMESDALDLINSIDGAEDEPEEIDAQVVTNEPEASTAPPAPSAPATQEPSINLSQFETLLNKILGGSKGEIEPPATTPEQQNIEQGQFIGNPLESEFEANEEKINALNQDKESYLDVIGGYAQGGQSGKNSPAVAPSVSGNEVEELEESDELNEWGKSEEDEYGHYGEKTGELKEEDELNEWGKSEEDEYGHYGEKTGELTEEDNPYDTDETDEDDDLKGTGMSSDDDDDDIAPVKDEEEQEPMTANGTANINGQPVKIILTGVMITPSEVTHVAECATKAGMKLTGVSGNGNIVHFIVESRDRKYIIRYEDAPKWKTKTPFSIKNETFQTLDEAFDRINLNKKKAIMEAKHFKAFMNDDIANRSITDIKEADILKEFQGKVKNYVPGWNVKAVGTINLKNGLNETYSNVTEHSKEANTLVKTKDGQFFLIKGNLKERSDVGTTRQLVDLEKKKDYGISQVVGVYENNLKGLGQIMYKLKRTSIPLLVWK